MITYRIPILRFILASLLANTAFAFELSFRAEEKESTQSRGFITTYGLQMNANMVSRSSYNTISLELPTEESILRFSMRKTEHSNHWESIIGEESTSNEDAYFLVSPDGRHVTGTFRGPSGSYYTVRTQADGKTVVDMIPAGNMEEESEPLVPPSNLLSMDEEEKNIFGITRADSGNSVDIMVVYTMNAMCLQAGLTSPCTNNAANRLPIENLIQLAVDNNNVAHTNSATGVQMNLVHTYLATGYAEPADSATALYDLTYTSSQGYPALDDVHSKRDTYGADMVMLMGTVDTGIAWLESSSSIAFSYMNRSYVSYHTMAHELGHNWGCHHDRPNESGTPHDYAHGYMDPDEDFRSILSYNCPTVYCPRVNFYSSPAVTYNGQQIGTATENCARMINERRTTVANFKQHVEGPTPTPPSPTPPTTNASLQITVKTDSKGSVDNSWILFKRNSLNKFVIVKKRTTFFNSRFHTNKYTFPKSSCFLFKMFDKSGDGLQGTGYFEVKWSGNIILWSKMTGKKVLTKTFGACKK